MSASVTVTLPAGRGGRGRRRAVRAPVAPDATETPVERIPRVARVLALAHHWQGLIRSGAVRDQAEIARFVGVSRARVTQVMNLLWLAPDIQEAVLDGRVDGSSPEMLLRRIAQKASWIVQRRRWAREFGGEATSSGRFA